MELVQPDHPIAQEAYETVKAMSCEYINIVAQAYQKSQTEPYRVCRRLFYLS